MTEEWVDCTKEIFPKAEILAGELYYVAIEVAPNSRLYISPHKIAGIHDDGLRVILNGLFGFRIERRIEKNFCLACGQEVKK